VVIDNALLIIIIIINVAVAFLEQELAVAQLLPAAMEETRFQTMSKAREKEDLVLFLEPPRKCQ